VHYFMSLYLTNKLDIPRETLSNDLSHPLTPGILDIGQPDRKVRRELDCRPLEDIHRSSRQRVCGRRRGRRIDMVFCSVQPGAHIPSLDSRSRFHRTRLSRSRLISYSAYLKKSSFLVTRLISDISKAVRRLVI
jgi:hypothetical protein